MLDDKKKQPYQDASDDQQKGGEATATDQDLTDTTDDLGDLGDQSGQTESDNDLTMDEGTPSPDVDEDQKP